MFYQLPCVKFQQIQDKINNKNISKKELFNFLTTLISLW